MQEIFKYIQQYWQIVLGAILFVLSLIIALLRKKPIYDIVSWIYKFAIIAINDCEMQPVYSKNKADISKEKLEYAVTFVCDELITLFPNIHTEMYEKLIVDIIECILTTPQKKGE